MATQRHNIVNSQFVCIEQTPASIMQRIIAQMIDWLILYVFALVTSIFLASITIQEHSGETISFILALSPLFYSPICEQFFNGRTIGKAAMGIRVVMLNGDSVSLGGSILRWLLSIVDLTCGIGLITALFNTRHQRLGDLAGGCIVIYGGNFTRTGSALKQLTYINEDYEPTFPFAAELTWGQVCFISETAQRSSANDRVNKRTLMNYLINKYGIKDPKMYPFKFLNTVVRDFHYYMLHEDV